FRQLVDPEDGDDVLQILVALQHLLYGARDVVMLLAKYSWIENARGRGQRIDGGIDTELGDLPREVRRGIQVSKRRGGSRICVVVGRDVDRLHRRDRSFFCRGDAFLELAHFGQQRRLVSDCGRRTAEERRHLRARLREAEDVVDEQKDVFVFRVAEIFGDGQRRQTDAKTGTWRLRHLAIDQRGARLRHVLHIDDAGFLELEPEVVAFAGAFTNTAE